VEGLLLPAGTDGHMPAVLQHKRGRILVQFSLDQFVANGWVGSWPEENTMLGGYCYWVLLLLSLPDLTSSLGFDEIVLINAVQMFYLTQADDCKRLTAHHISSAKRNG
jgi:hypothetical protein